ncbi:codeine O-demethylase-like [Papaver somniferum]|uniref:codeine O-demethylase-like n=1 Tax=Papaver somniferum TaxID=3469 RepID=UPI000E6FC130|nr:codeine O-demethylase-like [Papaver somniferum]
MTSQTKLPTIEKYKSIRKDKKWIPIKPLPNAFVVNIGNILEIMTNGIYRSVEHRAIIHSTKERLLVAAFHNPKVGVEIGPIPRMITPESPALFKTIGYEDYCKKYFSRKPDGKSSLDFMKIGEGNEDNKAT